MNQNRDALTATLKKLNRTLPVSINEVKKLSKTYGQTKDKKLIKSLPQKNIRRPKSGKGL